MIELAALGLLTAAMVNAVLLLVYIGRVKDLHQELLDLREALSVYRGDRKLNTSRFTHIYNRIFELEKNSSPFTRRQAG